MEKSLRKNFLNALHGNPVNRIPALSVTQTGTVELMDMTGAAWPEAHSDPEKMAKLAIAGHEIAGFEAVRYPYCLTVLAETTLKNPGRVTLCPMTLLPDRSR
jgi:[methyl-Co(III) methanol-specific corrinoid protein]:coenzyme M methyltransferase